MRIFAAVSKQIGLLFLNDNKNATFLNGTTAIPVKAGAFVIFMGDVPHNTIINTGLSNLLEALLLLKRRLSLPVARGGCTTDDNCEGGKCECTYRYRHALRKLDDLRDDPWERTFSKKGKGSCTGGSGNCVFTSKKSKSSG